MKKIQSKTIVFLTGAFVTNQCWNEWKTYFEGKGYTCTAPAWPHKDADAVTLKDRNPDVMVASNRLADLTNYYANLIKKLPEKPILIGHSLGGLLAQLLLQRDLAAAGVAIHPAAPQGVITTKFSFLKSVWKPLGYFTSTKKTHLMSLKEWQYAFTNGMSLSEQESSYRQFAIPESKLVLRDGLTKAAKVDFAKERAPLLITSGSIDHIIPASLNYSNFKKYKTKNSITDYKEFAGRNHFVLGQSTWKEDADYILDWIQRGE